MQRLLGRVKVGLRPAGMRLEVVGHLLDEFRPATQHVLVVLYRERCGRVLGETAPQGHRGMTEGTGGDFPHVPAQWLSVRLRLTRQATWM